MMGVHRQRYVRCLQKQKWLSLTGFIVCVGLAGGDRMTILANALYQAQGTLLYEKPLDI